MGLPFINGQDDSLTIFESHGFTRKCLAHFLLTWALRLQRPPSRWDGGRGAAGPTIPCTDRSNACAEIEKWSIYLAPHDSEAASTLDSHRFSICENGQEPKKHNPWVFEHSTVLSWCQPMWCNTVAAQAEAFHPKPWHLAQCFLQLTFTTLPKMLRISVLAFVLVAVDAELDACVGEACPSRSQLLLQVAKDKTQTLGATCEQVKPPSKAIFVLCGNRVGK